MSLRSSIAGLRASSQRLESVVAGRNKVINGNFAINQVEVSGTVSLASGEYGHDGWKAGASGCTYTFAESEGVTTLTMTAGSLIQVVEGANLFSGPHVLSWEGTAQGKIGAGSYADSGVGASVTGGADLEIEFGTGTLAKVQFEPGQYRTVFEHLHPQTDLERCQRYYWRCQFPDVNFGSYASGAYFTARLFFPSSMRATPTMNYSMTGTASNCSISSVGSASPQGARLLLQSSAISTNCYVQANAGDYIEADARL